MLKFYINEDKISEKEISIQMEVCYLSTGFG